MCAICSWDRPLTVVSRSSKPVAIGQRLQRVAHRRLELALVAHAQVVRLGMLVGRQQIVRHRIGRGRARALAPQVERHPLRGHRHPAGERPAPRVRLDARRLAGAADEQPLPQDLANLVVQLGAVIDARHRRGDRRPHTRSNSSTAPGSFSMHALASAKSST